MKSLKQLISEWRNTYYNHNTSYYRHQQQINNIMLRLEAWKQERAAMMVSNWSDSDKDIIMEFYDKNIDQCANELYWCELFYELNIEVR